MGPQKPPAKKPGKPNTSVTAPPKGGDLYQEAADVLAEISKKGTSGGLRTIIYNNQSTRRSDPRQLYALVSSTLKFRDLLTSVIKASGMMKVEARAVSFPSYFKRAIATRLTGI